MGGYYELVTPVGSTQCALDHLRLSASLRKNVTGNYCNAGNMIYTSDKVNFKFRKDSESFYQKTLEDRF